MAHIPGLSYAQPKAKSKMMKVDGRLCQVVEANTSSCLVTFTLKGTPQRAVLPPNRLYSSQGPCGHERAPVVGEKIFCDMTHLANKCLMAPQWLVAFAWRGRLDSVPRDGPLSAVTGLCSEVGDDSGVLLFVTPDGCRERCAFGRTAVEPGGARLPAGEPLSRHLVVGDTVQFDCRRTTAAANCRWLADRVWRPLACDDSNSNEDGDEDRVLLAGERGEFILRVTLKAVVGRVELVRDYKAVLTFEHGDQRHRALMLTAKYTFPEKATAAERRDLSRVLSRGDLVQFTCHEYDKPHGTDRCGWWVMEAVRLEPERAVGREAGYFQSGHLYEKIGTVKDLCAAEGLLQFVLDNRREVAWFSSQEVFINGRPCGDRLSAALDVGQRVNFNAEPSPAPRGATWRCTCVWRGQMPAVEASNERFEAAAAKKQKKSKPGKSGIDELDDFEQPVVSLTADGDARTSRAPLVSQQHGAGERGGYSAVPCCWETELSRPDALRTERGGSGTASDGELVGRVEVVSWSTPPELASPIDEDGSAGEAPAETGSSGPSRPLSDASVDSPLGPSESVPSPGRSADQRQTPPGGVSAQQQQPLSQRSADLGPAVQQGAAQQQQPLSQRTTRSADLGPAVQQGAAQQQQPLSQRTPRSADLGPAVQQGAAQQQQPLSQRTPRSVDLGPAVQQGAAQQQQPLSQRTTRSADLGPAVQQGAASARRTASQTLAAPPGLTLPSETAGTAAATNFSFQRQRQHQLGGPKGLFGDVPAQQQAGLLSTLPLPSFPMPLMMGHAPGVQTQWQHLPMPYMYAPSFLNQQMMHQAAARDCHMAPPSLHQGAGASLLQQPVPPPPMPPLTVEQEGQRHVSRGDRPLFAPVTEERRVAAAAAFRAAAPADRQSGPSVSVDSSERCSPYSPDAASDLAPAATPVQPSTLESLSHQLDNVGLRDDFGLAGGEGCLEGVLDNLDEELEEDGLRFSPSPSPAAVEPVSGRGQILAFVDESRGLAEWDRDGHQEQVMFDRAVCYWLGSCMDTLDLTDCYSPGAQVAFECVPAPPEEPYRWVATYFEQLED